MNWRWRPLLRALLMMLVLMIGCTPAAASLRSESSQNGERAGALDVRHAYETDREALHEASPTYALVGYWRRGGDDLADNAGVHRKGGIAVAPPTSTAADGVAGARSASGAGGAGGPGAPTVSSYLSPWPHVHGGSGSGSSGCGGRVGNGRGITPVLLVAVCSLVLLIVLSVRPMPWVSWLAGMSTRVIGGLAMRRHHGRTCARVVTASRRRRAAGGRGAGWRGRLAPPCVHRIRNQRRVCRALEWLRSRGFQRYVCGGCVQAAAGSGSGGQEPVDDGRTRPSCHRRHQMSHLVTRRAPRGVRWRRRSFLGIFPRWCFALAALAGRIGEASNPGPQWRTEGDVLAAAPQRRVGGGPCHGFDDPDGDGFHSEDDECGAWGWGHGSAEAPTGPPSEADLTDADTEPELRDDGASDHPVDAGCDSAIPFIAAKSFAGPRHGRVFKLGEQGLGYYLDAGGAIGQLPPVVSSCTVGGPGAQRTAVRIALDQLVPRGAEPPAASPAAATPLAEQPSTTSEPLASQGRQRGRRGRRRRRGTEPFELPRECKLRDESHRRAGLWALDTINPNAWPRAVEHIGGSAADVVMVQEVRRGSCDVNAAEREAAATSWTMSLAPGVLTQAGRISAGVAVGVRSHIGLADGGTVHGDGPAAGVRCAVAEGRYIRRWAGCMCRGGIHVGSVYLRTAEGMSDANVDILQHVAEDLAGVRGPWILGGDFNMTAEELAASGWLDFVGGVAIVPPTPSCNGKAMDFFVVAETMSNAVLGAAVVEDAAYSPHSAVRLYVAAAPRSLHKRGLIAPKRIGASLPAGCLPRSAAEALQYGAVAGGTCVSEWILRAHLASGSSPQPASDACGAVERSSYAQWICDAERDLVDIMGVGDGDAAKWKGRERGPRFAWLPALGSIAAKEAGSTAAAREWRSVRAWALSLRRAALEHQATGHVHAGVAAEASAARRRLAALIGVHREWLLKPPSERTADVDVGPRMAAVEVYKAIDSPPVLEQIAAAAEAGAAAIERAERAKRRRGWRQWLRGGPCSGLGRQHRFVRTVHGWVRAKVGCKPASTLSSLDDSGSLNLPERRRICTADAGATRPLTRQETAELEATEWGQLWAAHGEVDPPAWPHDLGPMPARPSVARLRAALKSFPEGTGLSWDALHPRALLRLSDERLEQLVTLLMEAERTGAWPPELAFVAIVLLPKEGGGLRPIGLFPCLIRVWMRLRRSDVEEWEVRNSRAHCYTGAGTGAHVAAWKQSARGELAAACGASYAQLLLDLAKAFEVVDHAVLVREAIAVGFPLPLLRLSLAAYRLPRTLVLDGCYSSIVDPLRGITAGSGTATVELKIMLMRLLDRVQAAHPSLRITSYVDDLSCEVAGTHAAVVSTLSAAGNQLCEGIVALKLRLSTSGKCICTSASPAAGHLIARRLSRFGVVFASRVRSLGAGLGGGTRRNVTVQMSRLRKFLSRVRKLAVLALARLSAARVLRTGGTAVMTFGDECMGVSDDLLLKRRRAVLAAVSAKNKGRDLDMALAMCEESGRQRLDPAFDACAAPIVRWAEAVWSDWLPARAMNSGITKARVKLAAARRPWAAVTGPAGAVVATAARIGWRMEDEATIVTDEGRYLYLRADPPAVVKMEVHAAVRRWRWARIVARHPQLAAGDANGEAALDPLRRLLRPSSRTRSWTAAQQSALRSSLTNGQWTQVRLAKAALIDDSHCQLCAATGAHAGVVPPQGTAIHRSLDCGITLAVARGALGQAWVPFRRGRRRARELLQRSATDDDDDPAPLCAPGTRHRVDATLPHRDSGSAAPGGVVDSPQAAAGRPDASLDDDLRGTGMHIDTMEVEDGADGGTRAAHRGTSWGLRDGWQRAVRRGTTLSRSVADAVIGSSVRKAWDRAASELAWTRGLVTLPKPPTRCQGPDGSTDGTFNWVVRPAEEFPLATFYTDGSLLDGDLGTHASIAWAFVALGSDGTVVAEANGVAPNWVRCISGAEAWALRMAALHACPGSSFITDSLNCVKAVKRGKLAARSPKSTLARAWLSLLSAFDDGEGGEDGIAAPLIWMPAHRCKAEIGHHTRSDGKPVTLADWTANNRADQLAKEAAYANRAPLAYRAERVAMNDVVAHLGRHIGWTTWAANNAPIPPFRDATSLTAAQRLERAARQANGAERSTRRCRIVHDRSPLLGGHAITRLGDLWRCRVCWKASGDRATFAAQKCGGAAVDRWGRQEDDCIRNCGVTATSRTRHVRWTTDGIVWCSTCGAYAESRARGLAAVCAGPPPTSGSGRTTALNRLRQGKHPKTGAALRGPAVPEDERQRDSQHVADSLHAHAQEQLHQRHRQREREAGGDDEVAVMPWGSKEPGCNVEQSCSDGGCGGGASGQCGASSSAAPAGPSSAAVRLAALRDRVRSKLALAGPTPVPGAVANGSNLEMVDGVTSATSGGGPPPPKRPRWLQGGALDGMQATADGGAADACMPRSVAPSGGLKRLAERPALPANSQDGARDVRQRQDGGADATSSSGANAGVSSGPLVRQQLDPRGSLRAGGVHQRSSGATLKRRRIEGKQSGE